jgi:hypothetical protein
MLTPFEAEALATDLTKIVRILHSEAIQLHAMKPYIDQAQRLHTIAVTIEAIAAGVAARYRESSPLLAAQQRNLHNPRTANSSPLDATYFVFPTLGPKT